MAGSISSKLFKTHLGSLHVCIGIVWTYLNGSIELLYGQFKLVVLGDDQPTHDQRFYVLTIMLKGQIDLLKCVSELIVAVEQDAFLT